MKKKSVFSGSLARYYLKKLCLMMRLMVFLTLVSVFVANANTVSSQSAKLTMTFDNASLTEVFEEIESQLNIGFLVPSNLLKDQRNINLSVKNATVESILQQVLDSNEYQFEFVGKNVVITEKNSARQSQQKPVKGIVTNTEGEPIPGVTVIVKGTTIGTFSDIDGKYTVSAIPGQILVFSFIGLKTQELVAGNQSQLDVMMEESTIGLDEVVAIGYGTMKKSDLTGSVSHVKGDDLVKVSAANVSTAIAGRLPGLQVTQSSGAPGATAVLRMRGVGSVYSGTDPLVLIDGFEGSIDQIAPSDVESITLLKDAASASIYGARAANGVVLITTKKGAQNQPLKLEISAQAGIQQATNLPDMLDSQEWCRKMNQSTMARSGVEYWTGDQASEKQTTNTDWLDYLFGNAMVQDYHISATGGAQKLRYSVNLGYFDQDAILRGGNYKRYSIRSNVDYISDGFSAGASVYQFRTESTSTLTSNSIYNAFRTPPTIPVYNADGLPGTPRSGYSGEDVLQDNTPSMDDIDREYESSGNSSTVNLYAELQLMEGLKFKTVLNATTTDSYNQTFYPVWSSYRPDDKEHETVFMGNSLSELEANDYTRFFWEFQNLLTYNKDIEKHHVDVLAGISAQKAKVTSMYGYISDLPRNTLVSLSAGSLNPNVSGSTGTSSLHSQFGRLNYSYASKYLVQLNVRRDGSSVFAPKNRWGVFPSASIGWRVTQENFLKDNPVITNLKVRVGVGTLGNSNIPSYKWLSTIDFYPGYVLGTNQELNAGANVSGAYNEDISWESTTTYNLGFDLSMYENKLNVSVELFKRKTTDMLLLLPLPLTTGYSSNPYVNIGGVDNDGWEFVAEYNNQLNQLKYNLSFNITHVKNKVVDMGGISPIIDSYTRTEEGEAISSFYGYIVEGIYQSEDDVANSPSFDGAKPGDFKYKDLDDSGDITADDRTFLGNAIPQFYYSGSINLAWKAFDMSVQLQGEANKKIMVTPEFGMDFGVLYDYANMYTEVYENRWTQEGDDSYYPALGSGTRGINNVCNTRWLKDASYLRVKSLQFGYTLPKQLFSDLPISNIRLFVTGTNLLTFTKYVGFDPEMGTRQKRSDSTGYMDKVYSRGGSDYPQAKTLQAGVKINF